MCITHSETECDPQYCYMALPISYRVRFCRVRLRHGNRLEDEDMVGVLVLSGVLLRYAGSSLVVEAGL